MNILNFDVGNCRLPLTKMNKTNFEMLNTSIQNTDKLFNINNI